MTVHQAAEEAAQVVAALYGSKEGRTLSVESVRITGYVSAQRATRNRHRQRRGKLFSRLKVDLIFAIIFRR